tara:strand:+ start:1211 stop:2065 length:855 start_codon:yes stop_codon:yes gene_type:complete
MGYALKDHGDLIRLEQISDRNILIEQETGDSVPLDPSLNTAGAALLSLQQAFGLDFGWKVNIKKGIPMGSGWGGSAASAVAAVVAAETFLPHPLTSDQKLLFALDGEAVTGARHLDNVAAAFFGGVTLCDSRTKVVQTIEVPELISVCIHPRFSILTSESRSVLPQTVLFQDAIEQLSRSLVGLTSLIQRDFFALKKVFGDQMVEPLRAPQIPSFEKIQKWAQELGIGASLSGSGPTVFGWFTDLSSAHSWRDQVVELWENEGLKTQVEVCTLNQKGARVIYEE